MASEEIVKKRGMYEFKPFAIKRLFPNTNVIPMGRSGHRIVANNACVYSFGGYNPDADENNGEGFSNKLFRELWKFNIAKQEWVKLDYFSETMPPQLASNSVLMKGDFMIIHGGTGLPFGVSNTNNTYIANLRSGSSLSLLPTAGSPPPARYGQAMVLDGQRLYVVGGTNGYDYCVDVHCLDLENMSWEVMYSTRELYMGEPEGRYRHEIAIQDSKILVFGGGTNSDVFTFFTVPAFDLETQTWETITTFRSKKPANCVREWFPPARRCHGCVRIPGDERQDPEVVICGGFDGIDVLSDVWRLNLRTFDWILCDCTLPKPVYFHATCVSPSGQMFFFGGIREEMEIGQTYSTRSNEIYTLWATIPKLKEMCWEALRHYCPDLPKYTTLELVRLGVPHDLIERLKS